MAGKLAILLDCNLVLDPKPDDCNFIGNVPRVLTRINYSDMIKQCIAHTTLSADRLEVVPYSDNLRCDYARNDIRIEQPGIIIKSG